MLFSSVPYIHIPEDLRREIGEMLSILVNQHYRYTEPLFARLEQAGVFLGNGFFAVAVIQESSPVVTREELDRLLPDLEQACRALLRTPLYYGVQANGTLHLILCYPRAEKDGEAHNRIVSQLFADFTSIRRSLAQSHPALHILISDVFFGESELYLAANSLHHAIEYDAFLTEKPSVVQLSTERQLHGAFVEDFHVYRRLSNQTVERLTAEDCNLTELSGAIVDQLIRNSSPSMESVHHHIQMFVLTLTEQLGSSGLVDSAYIREHHIVRKSMAFETEAELRGAMEGIVRELHRQYLMLTAIGKQRQIQTVRDYVEAHISDCNLSVNMLAELFALSPSQLTKQFRRYYAVSLHQFIQTTRLQKAKALIAAHPDWTLQKISDAAGYIDTSTMYRVFKKVDGTSPGTLKQQVLHGGAKTDHG